MPLNVERPAQAERGPSRIVLVPTERREDSSTSRRNQALAKSSIMATLTGALDGLEPGGRTHVLAWLAERAFLGILHERGAREAALVGYRLADALAGCVQ